TAEARWFLSCARRTGQRFGAAYLIDVLRGSENERITRFGHNTLKVYGQGADRTVAEWRHIADELIRAGYAQRVEQEYNAVRLTPQGLAVLAEGDGVLLRPPPPRALRATVRAAAGVDSTPDDAGEALFEELRALRKRLADERQVPPYVVFPDT